jgi:hypothetical protein
MKKSSIALNLIYVFIITFHIQAISSFENFILEYQLSCLALPFLNMTCYLALTDEYDKLLIKKNFIEQMNIDEQAKIIKLAKVEHVISSLSELQGLCHPDNYTDNIPTAIKVSARSIITGILLCAGSVQLTPLQLSLNTINGITSLPTIFHYVCMTYKYHQAKSQKKTIDLYTIEDILTQDVNESFAAKINRRQYNPHSASRQYLQNWRNLHPEQHTDRSSSAPTTSYSQRNLEKIFASHILSGDPIKKVIMFLVPSTDSLSSCSPDLNDHIGNLNQNFYNRFPRNPSSTLLEQTDIPANVDATQTSSAKNLTDYINSYQTKNYQFLLKIKVLDDAQYDNQQGVKIEKLSKEESDKIKAGFKISVEKHIAMKKNSTRLDIIF